MTEGTTTSRIPGLGTQPPEPIAFSLAMDVYALAQQADENERAAAFVDKILTIMLEDHQVTESEIADLPDEGLAALINLAADNLGIREEFDRLPAGLPLRERLYQAQGIVGSQFRETMDGILEVGTELARQAQAQLSKMWDGIGNLLREWARQEVSWVDGVTEPLRQFGESITAVLEEINDASAAIGPVLSQSGFWIPPSAPLSLIRGLRELSQEEGITPETMKQAIVAYSEASDCRFLRHMVGGWQENDYLADRMDIIDDALAAHVEGKYTLSIPSLLPLVEGLLVEIVGERFPFSRAGNELQNRMTDFMRETCKDIVAAHLTRQTYAGIPPPSFTPSEFSRWLKDEGLASDQWINRHAILHGIQMGYASCENSIRVFFLLDVLHSTSRTVAFRQRMRASP